MLRSSENTPCQNLAEAVRDIGLTSKKRRSVARQLYTEETPSKVLARRLEKVMNFFN